MQVYLRFRPQAFKPCFQSVDCWVLIEKYSHNTGIKEHPHEDYEKVTKIYVHVRSNDALGKFLW